MPTPGQELSSIDFEAMIGGPLVAVVNAQAQAAMSSVNFIKEVGFKKPDDLPDPDNNATEEPIYVKFKYPKEIKSYTPTVYDADGVTVVTPAEPAVYETQVLEVPILTLLPIPFIRVDEATVDFNAKINSTTYRRTDTNLKVDAALELKARWLWGSAKLNVSTSFQKNTQQGNEVRRTYSMAVHVKVVQDEMPAGMERVLGILEDGITSTPATGA